MPDRNAERQQESEPTPATASSVGHAARAASAADLIDIEAAERANPTPRQTVLEAIAARRSALENASAPTYSADDMVAAEPGADSGRRAIIRTAFRVAGVARLPLDEARALVDHFGGREVAMPGGR